MKRVLCLGLALAVAAGMVAALAAAAVVNASLLNVRETPSVSAAVLARLDKGSQVEILSYKGDWAYIQAKIKSGTVKGYVLASYLLLADGPEEKTAKIRFYDDVAKKYITVEKTFYEIYYNGSIRRFDTKVPKEYFELRDGKWRVSTELTLLTKAMAKALYKAAGTWNTAYGVYYRTEKDENAKAYAPGIHEGMDFGGPERTCAYYSLTDGIVTSVKASNSHDEYSWIGVRVGAYTVFYVHGSASQVKVGDAVKKGQKLGLQGDYGARGAYHVHVEVVKGAAKEFNRSKDTMLVNDCPYEFWREIMN